MCVLVIITESNSLYSIVTKTGGQRERLLVGCLTSKQHANVSQGRIYTDNCRCCHTEIEVADQTFYLTQSQYIDTGPTSPSVDPITPGAWQGNLWSANFAVAGMTRPGKIPSQAGFELRTFRFRGGRLNHLAKEAVGQREKGTKTCCICYPRVDHLPRL